MKDISAQSCVEALYREWIAVVIIADGEMQFESFLFSKLGKVLGIKRHQTTGR